MAGNSNKNKRVYSDKEIEIMRQQLKEHYLNQRLDPEFETYPDDWCVYSWAEGNMIQAMHPHEALLLELQGEQVTNMTDKHGMRPAHLKWVERYEQQNMWEGSRVKCLKS